MKTKCIRLLVFGIASLYVHLFAAPVGTGFQYQGRLNDAGRPATGRYDLRFELYDSETGPVPFSERPITNAAVAVVEGLFTVQLDFGPGVFGGSERWLEVGVRTNGGGSFVVLAPRQPLLPVPYSLFSPHAELASHATSASVVLADGVSAAGLQGDSVTTGKIVDGTIGPADLSPDLRSNTFWRLDGNSGATPDTPFLGTVDNQALELKAFNRRILRLEPAASGPNVIGGYESNLVFSGWMPGKPPTYREYYGSTVGGGGSPAALNAIYGNFGTIGGGLGNGIGDARNETFSEHATIGGGWNNTALGAGATVSGGSGNQAAGDSATVGGGVGNTAGSYAGVGAGWRNIAAGAYATVGGGWQNEARGNYATVAGGETNAANAEISTVAGGFHNHATGQAAFVGGGHYNLASAPASAVVGGWQNVAAGPGSVVGGGGIPGSVYPGNTAWGHGATVAGGSLNTASNWAAIGGGVGNQAHGEYAVVGGGSTNAAGGSYATVAGGHTNRATGAYSTVSGGRTNLASAPCSTVSGGWENMASGESAAVGGGRHNIADGDYSASLGGVGNRAHGAYSVALGAGALAWEDRSFVWSDGLAAGGSSGPSSFNVWARRVDFQARESLTIYCTNIWLGGSSGGGSVSVPVLHIRGGADLAEPFDFSTGHIPKGSVVVIDENNPGRLKLSEREYDRKVAGVVSGANGIQPGITLRQEGALDGQQNVALSGRVYVLAEAGSGPIDPGDLLTTSAVPGHAMKVTDHARAQGAVFGKAMTGLKRGRGMVLVLVSLQ